MLDIYLGKVLAWHRHDKKLTQKQLGARVGVHDSVISDIENGKKKVSAEEIVKICGALGIPLLDVMDQAYVDYRNEVMRSAQESGGWLMNNSTPSLPEMDERLSSLLENFGTYAKDFHRFMRQPSQVEILRANLAVDRGEAGKKGAPRRRGRPPKASNRRRRGQA